MNQSSSWQQQLVRSGLIPEKTNDGYVLYRHDYIQLQDIRQVIASLPFSARFEKISYQEWLLKKHSIEMLDNTASSETILQELLKEAKLNQCSDIHLVPQESRGIVLFRIDGQVSQKYSYTLEFLQQMVSRLKALSNLDIAEVRKPQDGRMKTKIGGETIDLRISCLPTQYGERLVMRLLFNYNLPDTEHTAMPSRIAISLKKIVNKPAGLLLVAGPTGCGKTTSLYSLIKSQLNVGRNIMTIEDPIEYRLHGVSQTQVNTSIGLDFSTGLRSILRQDPDIILIGEIRDSTTANIAVSAGMTGHLVLSTIHAETIRETLNRLVDLQVSTWLLSSSLIGIVEQRLLRKICMTCKYDKRVTCIKCGGSGYSGRKGIYNFARVLDSDRQHLWQYQSLNEYKKFSWEESNHSLLTEANKLIDNKVTNHIEVERVLHQ